MYAERWQEDVKSNPKLPLFHTVIFSAEGKVERESIDMIAMRAHRPVFPHPIVPHLIGAEIMF
jgi:hypothetical protein